MKLTLGFSPCPNDTFMFDAMIHGKIDTEGLEFEVIMEDVEALNSLAFEQKLDITKLSYHAFGHLLGKYELLDAGSALGNNCGPLLIAKKEMTNSEINSAKIAIPGKMTTANFLLSLAYPHAKQKAEMLFSEIEDAVISGAVDAGLIIHENRFTYQEKGLVKLLDCGAFWETMTGLPIPLGGIVVKSDFDKFTKLKINRVMRRSVEFAFKNPTASSDFVKKHAREMDEKVIRQHIELYVNDYSVSLERRGRRAVETLFKEARKRSIIENRKEKIFIN